jgi:4-hydroxy-L-threonine phosphate dehydrogenase PdxA
VSDTPAPDGPRIALAMGDPAGIGPELICRALADPALRQRGRPVVVGDAGVIAAGARAAGVALDVTAIPSLGAARFRPGRIEVLTPEGAAVGDHAWGRMTPGGGQAALAALTAAAQLPVDGVVSAPLNKEALRLAGMRHADELGLLAELTDSPDPVLIGVLPTLWTICVTSHVAMREVPDRLTRAAVSAAIERLAGALASVRAAPRLAVAALNPHAGEGGHLGREEIDELEPAVRDARAAGVDVIGPLPSDTIFPRALADGLDGVVCMYHDQANIARKLQPMRSQATLYLGLPVPVGTTAHGTAFDRAGTGTASPESLRAALDATIALAGRRR